MVAKKRKTKQPQLKRKRIFIGLLGTFAALGLYLFWGLPNPLSLSTHPAPVSTQLLDRNGKLIYEIFTDRRRTPIKLEDIPDHAWQATIASEDKDFYTHSGFSLRGIARAFV